MTKKIRPQGTVFFGARHRLVDAHGFQPPVKRKKITRQARARTPAYRKLAR